MEEILKKIKDIFDCKSMKKQRDDLYFIEVHKDKLVSLLVHMKDLENFKHLSFLTAVDYIEEGKFQLTYMLCNHKINISIGIKTFINRENAEMYSSHHLWEQMSTYQRELYEMFGINFPGSPRLRENFILEGWEDIPPMRKEFDTLKYSKENYYFRSGRKTNDPATYMNEKLKFKS